jgi:UDP-N-acetylmuramoyl-tripeptide--D-alanyl-D-alanine ligase
VTLLHDSYHANPASMEAALVALAGLEVPSRGRRFAVLGDMRELGRHHYDAHREVGERTAVLALDVVVGVGAGGAAIAQAARAGGVETHVVADAADAVRLVAPMLHTGDAVLVKGSRALGLERVADGVLASAREETGRESRHECSGGGRS